MFIQSMSQEMDNVQKNYGIYTVTNLHLIFNLAVTRNLVETVTRKLDTNSVKQYYLVQQIV
jgi:hypothetical protein